MSHRQESLVSCPDANLLSAFVARTLAPAAHASIEGHLDGCAVCLSAVTEMARSLASDASVDVSVGPPLDVEEERGGVFGRYTIVELLGRGGMGTVYVAHDGTLDRRVALKVLKNAGSDLEAAARMGREARLMARLVHPNIVTVYDAGAVDGRAYISMELVEGQTLAAWLLAAPRSLDEILRVYRSAGEALAAAHAAGIVHRDFKPENVLLDRKGRVLVTDFGLASGNAAERSMMIAAYRGGAANVGQSNLTRTGALLGTPRYMSPEQHRGAPAGPASDQFSFAVALYEAVYRQPPFSGETPLDRRLLVLSGRLSTLPEHARARNAVPGSLHQALLRALSLDPSGRFSDMRALLEAISVPREERRTRVGFVVALAAAMLGAMAVFGLTNRPYLPTTLAASAGDAGATVSVAPAKAAPVVPAAPVPKLPTVYFVVDNSSGMNRGTKWTNVRSMIESVERDFGAHAAFGATMFPGKLVSKWACAPGSEVFAPTQGDVADVGVLGDAGEASDAAFSPARPPHLARLLHALDAPPQGATPATATLLALRSELSTLRHHAPLAVVLVTDGGVTCSTASACEAYDCATNIEANSGCTPDGPDCCQAKKGTTRDCLDQGGAVQAVSELQLAGIPTYVVGVDPPARYRSVLDALARAGGTARDGGKVTDTSYYDVNNEAHPEGASALRADLGRALSLR